MHLITIGDTNVKTQKTAFSPEFRLEKTQSVVDNRYTHKGAAQAMGVGYSTIINWVKQLREERSGLKPKAAPMMAAKKIEIPELKKRIQDIE